MSRFNLPPFIANVVVVAIINTPEVWTSPMYILHQASVRGVKRKKGGVPTLTPRYGLLLFALLSLTQAHHAANTPEDPPESQAAKHQPKDRADTYVATAKYN